MGNFLKKLVASKRIWIVVAGLAAPGIGIFPAAIAAKVMGAAIVATKIIDVLNEQYGQP